MQRWQKKKKHFPLIALIFFGFITIAIIYNESNFRKIYQDQIHTQRSITVADSLFTSTPAKNFTGLKKPSVGLDKFSACASTVPYSGRRAVHHKAEPNDDGRAAEDGCDFFSGQWVFDNTSYPLYNGSDCPYMSDQLACQKHGRKDLRYQFWRWQPHNCNLKRWNATEMWEKLRGKRLMFVGDSLNRGQWISMLCLLQSVIPANQRSITPNSELTVFTAENYNASVEFLWAPLLVESNSDDAVDHRLDERIFRPDAILRHSSRWEKADILIFNSFLWWRQGHVKLAWSDDEVGVCEKIDGLKGMELAMEAWADWVASNVDPRKTKVFFSTMSPTHQMKSIWSPGSDGNCYNEQLPITDENYRGSDSDFPTLQMVENVLTRLGSKVSILNITRLSDYRRDGHPTIFRKFWEPLSTDKIANPESYSDCIHWCLPGVPDVWNELLFQFI